MPKSEPQTTGSLIIVHNIIVLSKVVNKSAMDKVYGSAALVVMI